MTTLTDVIQAGDATQKAVVATNLENDDANTWTRTRLRENVHAIRDALLAAGVRTGDVVSIVIANGAEYLLTFLATTLSRAVAAPLNSAYKTDEFKFFMEDAGSKVVILLADGPENTEAVAAAEQLSLPIWRIHLDGTGDSATVRLSVSTPLATEKEADASGPVPDDVGLFLHTSGTTSRPKGVPLTHRNILQSLTNIVNTYELSPTDCSYIVMPLFHVHGLIGATLSTLLGGGSVVIPPRFSASVFWKQVDQHGVTWYSSVPTIHQILLLRAEKDNAPTGKLRFIRSCSSSLAPSVLAKLEERFGAAVLEAYGMTEACHQMSSNPLRKNGKSKAGSVGTATNVGISIRDDDEKSLAPGERGEVCITGKNVTPGYHNRPDANKDNFFMDGDTRWFRTGDQAYLDEEGYLFLVGRIKELINRGGEKISPMELDSIMLEHAAVAEAVAFAAPDEKYGEQVNAAVVPKEGQTVTPDEIIALCKERVAEFKVPVRVFVADYLPKTATGKIQRRIVSAHFLKTLEN